MTQTIKLAVIPGDGIGKEVVPEGLKVLERALEGTGVTVRPTAFDLGAERWHRTGQTLTDEDLEAIKTHDAILLGAVGDPSVPSGVLERGLLLRLRFALDHYVNLRPSVYYPGVPTPLADPGDIDFVVVREGTEGLYCGNGGVVRQGTAHEIATEVSVNTAYGVERLVRYAFAKARSRAAKHLTLVHKHNVLVNAGHLWRRTVAAVGAELYARSRIEAVIRSALPGLSEAATLSVPTPEHYLPLLYTAALREPQDDMEIFNDELAFGSISMTSVLIG